MEPEDVVAPSASHFLRLGDSPTRNRTRSRRSAPESTDAAGPSVRKSSMNADTQTPCVAMYEQTQLLCMQKISPLAAKPKARRVWRRTTPLTR